MDNALGYTRVSTNEQAREGLSLEAQAKKIGEYCKFKGIKLKEVYEDAGISGYTQLKLRPQGKKLIQQVENTEIDHVVSIKLDRLFRNSLDCLNTVDEWNNNDIAVHFIDMGGSSMDTSSAMGRFFLTVMAGTAEMERALTRERILAAMEFKRQRGDKLGQPPYGLKYSSDRRRWVQNRSEQAVIREIRALNRKYGMSYRKIASYLNEQGVPARLTNWHYNTIMNILKRGK